MLKKNNFSKSKRLENQFVKLISRPTDYYIEKIFKKNRKFDFNKPVVLFGAAKMGSVYYDLCKKNNIEVVAFCDNDKSKQNLLIKNINVISPSVLKNKYGDDVQIIISSTYDDEIKSQLTELGFKNIWSHMFFSTVYAKKFNFVPWTNQINYVYLNKEKLIKCFNSFNDFLSKKVFFNVIKYRLTLDRKYLAKISGDVASVYFDKSIYNLSDKEVFIDGGAFDGDTVELFMKAVNNKFKKIYCFEPDDKSYLDLKNFVDKINNKKIKITKYGLGSKIESVYFTNDGSLGSKISAKGKKIKIVSMDKYIKDNITLVKLDIEGYEKDALMGFKKTMLESGPKLTICVYHKITDLWEIPLFIRKINPNYKIYLRHYSPFLLDTICYAIS